MSDQQRDANVDDIIKFHQKIKSNQKQLKTTVPTIIYVLYLLSIIMPFIAIIGLVMAYVNKDDEDSFLQSHYQFQIRTFWIGLLYLIIGGILTTIVIGWLIVLFYIVWLIIRCVKGFKYLGEQEPIPEPTSWMFG